MKPYIISFAVGVLVGVIYALMNVRSPAPPVITLAGLLGILIGEHEARGKRPRLGGLARSTDLNSMKPAVQPQGSSSQEVIKSPQKRSVTALQTDS